MPKNRFRVVSRLAEVATAQGLPAVRIAQRAELSYNTVYAFWRKETTMIDFRTLAAICEVLECTPGDLLVLENGVEQ